MKKVLVVLAFSLLLTFSACGDATLLKDGGDTVQQIEVGDMIVTENMEVTINSIELTYDVLPDNTDLFYTHYTADKGMVYICVDADVTNKAKQNLRCDDVGRLVADYNGGYKYRGFVVVEDSTIGFTYANITSIMPLETKSIKWLVECPQEVEETEKPLHLEFTVDGTKFVCHIR